MAQSTLKEWLDFLLDTDEPDSVKRLDEPLHKGSSITIKPRVVAGVDEDGIFHPLVDTDGFLKVENAGFLGTIVTANNTFTKDAIGTTGIVQIIPATGDELKLLYGNITIGPGRTTTTGDLILDIGSSAVITRLIRIEAAVSASETFFLPSPGEAVAAGNMASSNNPEQMRMSPTEPLQITLLTMANTELFNFNFRLLSKNGVDPNIAAVGGALS